MGWFQESILEASTPPASKLPSQPPTFFSVYQAVLDHCETITQAIMRVLRFSVIAFVRRNTALTLKSGRRPRNLIIVY